MKRISARSFWAAVISLAVVSAGLFVAVHGFLVSTSRTVISSLPELPAGSPVHFVGVVTYADGPGRRFWIEDETGSVAVPLDPVRAGVRVGETLAVDARKALPSDHPQGGANIGLTDVRVRPSLARIRLPLPVPTTIWNFPAPDKNGIRVVMEGVLQDEYRESYGRAGLSLSSGGASVDVTIAHPAGHESRLLNSTVRVSGVAEQVPDAAGVQIPHLWVPTQSGVQVVQPAPAAGPLLSIRRLYRLNRAALGHLVRVRGRVAASLHTSLLLAGRWGTIECNLYRPQDFRRGAAIEVTGYPHIDGLRIDLYFARAAKIAAQQIAPPAGALPPRPLTTVMAVRQLPVARAARALPVQITGVITYDDPIWRQLYFQDQTAGIYVKYSGAHPELHAGERVTLTGITNPGNYAPVIVAPRFHVLGPAPMPVPIAATSEEATAGLLDSQYVTIVGIVHPLKFNEQPGHPIITFDLYTSLGQIHVFTSQGQADLSRMRHFEDARVRIQGVFSTVFNSRRQLVGYQMLVSSPEHIQVLEPGVPNLFSMEATPIGALLRFAPGKPFGHRVKIAGSVTLVEPDFLYLQDKSGGVEVQGNTRGFRIGERLEAAGYPTLEGRYSPVMTDAEFHALPGISSVAPQITNASAILRGQYDSQLVAVEGRLLATLASPGSVNLVLQSGIQTFTAELDTSSLGGNPLHLRDGSILRLTGVASAQIDPDKLYLLLQEQPVSFKILLRTPADVTVIRAAPYWTSRMTVALLVLLSLLIAVILVWVGVLRRRVERQKAALEKANQTAQAIRDLATAMTEVSRGEKFDTEVSVRGSEEIAGLVMGFNHMLKQLQQKDRARREAEAQLLHQALADELTGLPNRRLLSDRLAQSLAAARREGTTFAFLYIDLDGFKLVNDSLGHATGDRLLADVGGRLKARTREADTLARIGGDEFAVILNRIDSRDDAQRVAEQLLQSLAAPFQVDGHEITIGASIGISIFPGTASENDDLLQQADSAMYAAKRSGKNRIESFSPDLGVAARERLTLENELRRALANGEIRVHYQPEFDLATRRILRFEALARWTHPNLGEIPPLSFIPVAEECGLIVPLGAKVMEQACREAIRWQEPGGFPIQVAVNVSSVQFARDTFVEEVIGILSSTGLPAPLLQLEVTESSTLIGIQRAAATMQRLKDLGITIVMDDFGSGYSCLSYLPKLPFDALKIDRSFVSELLESAETRALVQSILSLGHNLGMKIIVEGIENEAQLRLIVEMGGNEAQGYLLGRPTAHPLEELRRRSTAPIRDAGLVT